MAKWPNTIVLVHGYARGALEQTAANGAGKVNDFWYWTGTYSDGRETYDVPQALRNSAAPAQVQIVAANWDGVSTIETSVEYLVRVLDEYCTGSNTCDLVGHSTGDALIGYALDKFQAQKSWNIDTVFVAGGAGGGTEAASWAGNTPLLQELQPSNMRALYNHNMSGKYAAVPNIRFVGAGTKYDFVNNIPYRIPAGACRGYSDGLVPFHSQGGVSDYVGTGTQANDAYCTMKHNGVFLACGQLHYRSQAAERWVERDEYQNIPLFDGFYIAMIDEARLYNHTDEVGRLAAWINIYKGAPGSSFLTTGLYAFHQGFGDSGQLWCSVFDGSDWTIPWRPDQDIANVGMSAAPSAVVYNGQLFVFHQGFGNSGQLWVSVLDNTWQADQQVANVGMSDTPSAVVYNGQLFVFHQGFGNSGQLWYSVFDGTHWQADQQVANVGMSAGPSAVVYNGQLFVFHQGFGNSGELWYSVFDGTHWQADQRVANVGMSDAPSAVVYGNQLYVFHQGFGNSGELWYSVFDGTHWQADQRVANVGMSAGPSAVVNGNQLYVFHQGFGNSGELWYSVYVTTNALPYPVWQADRQVANVGMSSSPGCVVLT